MTTWKKFKSTAPPQKGGGFITAQSTEQLVQRTALHEAGHIVAALADGFRVSYSIIELQEKRGRFSASGYTEINIGVDAPDANAAVASLQSPEMVQRRVMQALAGTVAERMLYDDAEADIAAEDDMRRAVECFVQAGLDDDITTKIQNCWAACTTLLKPHRETLVTFANKLLASPNTRLTGETFTLDC